MLIWNERHFRAVLSETVRWYNGVRVHQGIRGIPLPGREYERSPPGEGKLVAIPILNGLHHDYCLAA